MITPTRIDLAGGYRRTARRLRVTSLVFLVVAAVMLAGTVYGFFFLTPTTVISTASATFVSVVVATSGIRLASSHEQGAVELEAVDR